MQPRTSWLFPIMVLAAAAAIAFSAFGILAITHRAPKLNFPANPLNGTAAARHVVATGGETTGGRTTHSATAPNLHQPAK